MASPRARSRSKTTNADVRLRGELPAREWPSAVPLVPFNNTAKKGDDCEIGKPLNLTRRRFPSRRWEGFRSRFR